MKYLATLFLIAIMSYGAYGQTVLLEETIDTIAPIKNDDYGANQRHFIQNTYGVAALINSEHTTYNALGGYSMQYGFRYKWKLTSLLALTTSLSYSQDVNASIKDRNNLRLNDYQINNDDQIRHIRTIWRQVNLSIGPRINFDVSRGDAIGKYLDLCAYGAVLVGSKHKEEINNSRGKFAVSQEGIVGAGQFTYGLEARIGFNWFEVMGRYRVSDLSWNWTDSNDQVVQIETIPLMVGINFNFPN